MGRLTCLKPRVQTAPDRVKAHTISETTRTRGGTWQRTRARILRRDNGLCWACSACGLVGLADEVDHHIPLWAAGPDEDRNLRSICAPHHKDKTRHEAAQRAAGALTDPWQPAPLGRLE